MAFKTSLAIFGSTGSIGEQSLSVVRQNPEYFSVAALAAGKNVSLLQRQIEEFAPRLVAVADHDAARELASKLPKNAARMVEIVSGPEGLLELVACDEVEALVMGISGFAAFGPVIAALRQNKHIALANKECLVAGQQIFREAHKGSSSLVVPVDSEHNSIYQCLRRRGVDEPIRKIILTASGGPFLKKSLSELKEVTPEMAIRHPRWNMGAKISVDSATLMNKALEVIEAAVLFNLDASQIEVLIHPESIIHGLVEYEDGTTLAALYEPDMRVPIAYALSVIRRHVRSQHDVGEAGASIKSGHSVLELAKKGSLSFFQPDEERFPALGLAYTAIAEGNGIGVVLNAANEVAVERFLAGKLPFPEIIPLVAGSIAAYKSSKGAPPHIDGISDIILIDSWGRRIASERATTKH